MANIFEHAGADKSIYYLNQIFGGIGGVLTGTPNVFMGSLFLSINTIALTVGAIIVVYTTVVGLMMTAHEGEFLGKKWSGLWVPIRMVAGVASLFPASSGYSMIQVIIMWIIVQGIGAADMLWSAAVTSAVSFGMPTNQSVAGATTSALGVSTHMKTLFAGLVCEQTYSTLYPASIPQSTEVKLKQLGSTEGNVFDINATNYPLGPSGVCGKIEKCSVQEQCKSEEDAPCSMCKAQNTLLKENVIPFLRNVATQFAKADSDYLVFYYTANKNPPVPSEWPPNASQKNWVADPYCSAMGFDIKEMGATCCVPPLQPPSPGPPPPPCLGKDVVPRTFPAPFDKPNESSNGMSTGVGSELELIERWSLFPILTGRQAPVNNLTPADSNKINIIAIATEAYTKGLMDEATALATKASGEGTNLQQKKFNPQEAKDNGWITAGAYFYKVVYAATQTLQANITNLSATAPEPSGEVMTSKYRSNYMAADDLLKAITANASSSNSSSSGKQISTPSSLPGNTGFDAALNDVTGTLSDSFMKMLQGASAANPGIHDTPLLRIATFGQNLLIIAQLFYVLIIMVGALASGILSVGTFVGLGVGNFTTPLEIFKGITSILYPALFLLLGALMTMGALLGMYVPMIPYVVFTASVIGWFIAVIEAMVAGPIIALGIMSPGGQSEIFGRAEQSVMIIFNLFLRPTLMVFGLLVAAFLANVVIKFIAMGFQYIMQDVMTLMPGLVEEVIFIAIFASIIFTSINQVFTLIHHIPERILTYIGGQAMQYGEAQAAQAMKGAVEGAAGGLAGAGKGTGEGMDKTAQSATATARKTGTAKHKEGGKYMIE